MIANRPFCITTSYQNNQSQVDQDGKGILLVHVGVVIVKGIWKGSSQSVFTCQPIKY